MPLFNENNILPQMQNVLNWPPLCGRMNPSATTAPSSHATHLYWGDIPSCNYKCHTSLPYNTAVLPVHCNHCNFDGLIDTGEECDDGNRLNNDGCSDCALDPIQLQFNSSVPAGTPYSIEFFDLDRPVFFADPGLLRFSIPPATVRVIELYRLRGYTRRAGHSQLL
jgi:cysteine-rich repeat protein